MQGFDIIHIKMSRTMPSAVAFLLCVSCMAMQPAEPVGVPELMKTFDGLPVTDRTIWETVRRRELRQRFLERMYGLPPVYAETPDVRFTLEEPDKTMMDGMAVRRRMRIHYRGPSGADSFIAIAFIPKSGSRSITSSRRKSSSYSSMRSYRPSNTFPWRHFSDNSRPVAQLPQPFQSLLSI